MAIVLSSARYRYAGSSSASLGPIDLTLERGRVLGVAGPNESGKTTLCLVASGLAPGVTGGKLDGGAAVDGAETATLRPYELAQRCGVLFQHAQTQLSQTTSTVFEEVAFGPCNLGLLVAEIADRVWQALRAVGIEELAPRDPGRLSGGQSQLVALAGVLALRPKYLILDEPTSELDPAGTALVAAAIVHAAREFRAGVLLVEHKTEVLAAVADEMVVLDRGLVALRGPAAEVLGDPRLAELGVEAPARTRLERRLRTAGLEWTAALQEALR